MKLDHQEAVVDGGEAREAIEEEMKRFRDNLLKDDKIQMTDFACQIPNAFDTIELLVDRTIELQKEIALSDLGLIVVCN